MNTLQLPRPSAVIFDMDGLLLDSERVALELFAQAATELNLPWQHEVGLSMIGLSWRDSNDKVIKALGDDYPIKQLREHFNTLYDAAIISANIPVKPYARDLLERLKDKQIPCAVATSTGRARALLKLTHTKLLPFFKAVACGDEVKRGKPSPDIFELAAQRLGVQASRCLALEDSNAGVRGAAAASMRVVMVPDLLKPDVGIRQLGVPCVDSLKAVLIALTL